MRIIASTILVVGLVSQGLGGKHDGAKKHGYGTGYVTESPRSYSCHEGYLAEGVGPDMRCVQRNVTPALPYCESGLLEGDSCVLREPAMFTCPPGYFSSGGGKHGGGKHGGSKHGGGKHDGVCMAIDRAPLELFCDGLGLLSGGQCLLTETAPLSKLCPLSDSKKHGGSHGGYGDCVEYREVLPVLSCPAGLTLSGAQCLGVEQRLCPMARPYYDDKKGGKKHGRHLGEKHHGGAVFAVPSKGQQYCDVDVSVPAIESCPAGSTVSGGYAGGYGYGRHGHSSHGDKKKHHGHAPLTCLETVPVALEPYCPIPGGLLDLGSNTCSIETHQPALSRCPAGFAPCSYDDKKKSKGKKRGGKKHHHGGFYDDDCCAISYADLLPGCPPNFTLYGNECKLVTQPLYQCPPDATTDQNGQCLYISYKPPKVNYTVNVTTKAAPVYDAKKKGHHHGGHGGHGGKHY